MAAAPDNDSRVVLRNLWAGWQAYRATVAHTPLDPFPLRHALKGYSWAKFKADLRAAFSVSLLDLPQSMAYANVAGLPIHLGPLCSATASTTGPLMASSRLTMLGPTNATAFMVFSYFAAYPGLPQLTMMPMLVLLIGLLLILGAYLRVADLAQYISRTVVVAYVTGAACLIIANQVPNVLGISLYVPDANGIPVPPRTLPGMIWGMALALNKVRWYGLGTALFTALVWFVLKRWAPRWPAFILALLAGVLAGVVLQQFDIYVATFVGNGVSWRTLLPHWPEFGRAEVLPEFSRLFGLALAVAFIATLESSSMARTLASRMGHGVDPNQDMLSLGVANLACAFTCGMPASGSLTRSALNAESGARSPVASILNGLLCLIGALLLLPFLGYVPKASLAVLVILIACSLIHRRHIHIALSATASDALVFVVTFLATLLVPLHVAIFTGVGFSIMLYLRKAAQPSLVEYEFNQDGNLAAMEGKRQQASISIVHVEGELFFGAAELFRSQMQRVCADPNLRIVILRLKNARHLDATSVMALEELVRTLRKNGRDLIISGAMEEVIRVLEASGLMTVIGADNVFPGSAANPNIATRNALKRAQAIIGSVEADVHIYVDPRSETRRLTAD